MKTLLAFFLVPLSFLLPSLTFAQVNCTSYLGGVTSCTGAGGYQYESRQHLNGQSSFYDNQGSSGTVTRTLNGGANVSPTQIGRSVTPGGVPIGHPTSNINVGSRHNEYYVAPVAEQIAPQGKLPATYEELHKELVRIKAWQAKELARKLTD